GREADAAIAHHDGGNALARLHFHRTDQQRAVIVRVHVDETRCDGATGDVDLLMRIGATECTQRGDTTFGDRKVAGNRRRAGAVIEQRIAQDKVEVFHVPSPAIARPAGLPAAAEKKPVKPGRSGDWYRSGPRV